MTNPNHATDERTRAKADELESRRQARFIRQARTKTAPEEERQIAQVVARAKEGDREAVRFLYLRYADNVYGYVRSIVRDDYEAEDITQQVFAKVITVLHRYEHRGVPFSRWILRLAHNASVDYIRARHAAPVEEVRGLNELAEDGIHERARTLRDALDTLPDDQREVVLMRNLGGFSPGEIAVRMGRSKSSVHGLHHRGRGALCAELRNLGAGPATTEEAVRAV